jgi:hypothetical protein
MKKIITLVLSLTIVIWGNVCFGESPLDLLSKNIDQVKQVTWYNNKDDNSERHITAYIGIDNNDKWLRLKIRYQEHEWLFINKYTLRVDNKLYTIDANGNVKRAVITNYLLREWYDCSVDTEKYKMIREIANSNKTIIRYEGENYYDDYEVSQKEKIALQQIITAFEYLGGKIDEGK